MKEWKVVLTDGREEFVHAQRYRREGDQYVFENDGDTDVQFFNAEFIVGIYELQPLPQPRGGSSPYRVAARSLF
jgi:hypothetical protein